MLREIGLTIWLLLPAWTPNNFAVLLGGGAPLDLGRNFIDGRRLLGDGKTIRGFIAGVAGGVLVANVQYAIEKLAGLDVYSSLGYSNFFTLTFLLALGAMLGDSVGSFIKRRMGFDRGSPLPVVDQLTFLAVSLLLASLSPVFWKIYTLEIVLLAFLLTPVAHVAVNALAYKMGLKEVPW